MNMYYIVVIGWSLYYLIQSFRSEVPWASCQHDWNTGHCRSDDELQQLCHEYYQGRNQSTTGLNASHLYHSVVSSANSINGTLGGVLLRECTDAVGNFSHPVREYWK